MRRHLALSLSLVFLLFVCGCAANQLLTAQRADLMFMSTYLAEYENLKTQAARTDLSEEQEEMLREKRDVLVRMKPLVLAYDAAVTAGQTPSHEQTQQILNLIDELTALKEGG